MLLRKTKLWILLIKISAPEGRGKEWQLRFAPVRTILTDTRGQPVRGGLVYRGFPRFAGFSISDLSKSRKPAISLLPFLPSSLARRTPSPFSPSSRPADEFFCLAKYVATVSNELSALYFASDQIVNHNYCKHPPPFELCLFLRFP